MLRRLVLPGWPETNVSSSSAAPASLHWRKWSSFAGLLLLVDAEEADVEAVPRILEGCPGPPPKNAIPWFGGGEDQLGRPCTS